jgi:hypothetical protein
LEKISKILGDYLGVGFAPTAVDWDPDENVLITNPDCSQKETNPNHDKITPGGTRTHNRLIRSQTPYPLGHRRFSIQLL